MIGVAMRIAQNIGLHRDGDGQEFGAFEAEMRRRLWWQILVLDMKAFEDRGTEPLLTGSSFTTVMPLNVNDEDFSYDSRHPLKPRVGPTQMTLSLLTMDALSTSRKINFGTSNGTRRDLRVEERLDLVEDYARRVKSVLGGFQFLDTEFELPYTMGQYWIHKLRLISHYPLHHQISPSLQVRSRKQGLHVAVKALEVSDFIEQRSNFANITWWFETHLPWHAVAVTLAKITTQPQTSLANRAWQMVENGFARWRSRVIDPKEAMLWGVIGNLRKRAIAARGRESQLSPQSRQVIHLADPGSPLRASILLA